MSVTGAHGEKGKGTKGVSEKNETEINLVFTTIALHPTLASASQYLLEAHKLTVSVRKMEVLQKLNPEWWERVRNSLAGRIEQNLANDALDTAELASMVEREAVRVTQQFLEEGKIADPSKTARDLADVKAKNVQTRLALEGRPMHITENRSPAELIRGLAALGVLKQADVESTAEEVPALEESNV